MRARRRYSLYPQCPTHFRGASERLRRRGVARREVAPRSVASRSRRKNAGQRKHYKHQYQDADDEEGLHPHRSGVFLRIGGTGGVVHSTVLFGVDCLSFEDFTIHPVHYEYVASGKLLAWILESVPKLWKDSIEAHHRDVREAILETTASLAAEHGLRAVTMSWIAKETGIGRATLYKYFSDVETILFSWHEDRVTEHLAYLAEVRRVHDDIGQRLEAVLDAFALITYERPHNTELIELLHRHEHIAHAHKHLTQFARELLTEAAHAGAIRGDVSPDELTGYCLHSLGAAAHLQSKAAVHRLVLVIMAGLRPVPGNGGQSSRKFAPSVTDERHTP